MLPLCKSCLVSHNVEILWCSFPVLPIWHYLAADILVIWLFNYSVSSSRIFCDRSKWSGQKTVLLGKKRSWEYTVLGNLPMTTSLLLWWVNESVHEYRVLMAQLSLNIIELGAKILYQAFFFGPPTNSQVMIWRLLIAYECSGYLRFILPSFCL